MNIERNTIESEGIFSGISFSNISQEEEPTRNHYYDEKLSKMLEIGQFNEETNELCGEILQNHVHYKNLKYHATKEVPEECKRGMWAYLTDALSKKKKKVKTTIDDDDDGGNNNTSSSTTTNNLVLIVTVISVGKTSKRRGIHFGGRKYKLKNHPIEYAHGKGEGITARKFNFVDNSNILGTKSSGELMSSSDDDDHDETTIKAQEAEEDQGIPKKKRKISKHQQQSTVTTKIINNNSNNGDTTTMHTDDQIIAFIRKETEGMLRQDRVKLLQEVYDELKDTATANTTTNAAAIGGGSSGQTELSNGLESPSNNNINHMTTHIQPIPTLDHGFGSVVGMMPMTVTPPPMETNGSNKKDEVIVEV
jgi:hypothetical protein